MGYTTRDYFKPHMTMKTLWQAGVLIIGTNCGMDIVKYGYEQTYNYIYGSMPSTPEISELPAKIASFFIVSPLVYGDDFGDHSMLGQTAAADLYGAVHYGTYYAFSEATSYLLNKVQFDYNIKSNLYYYAEEAVGIISAAMIPQATRHFIGEKIDSSVTKIGTFVYYLTFKITQLTTKKEKIDEIEDDYNYDETEHITTGQNLETEQKTNLMGSSDLNTNDINIIE